MFSVISEEKDKEEAVYITSALKKCGYPQWSMDKVKDSKTEKCKNLKKEKKKRPEGSVVIPYVKGLSESTSRIMKKHGIIVSMRPHYTLRKALVHPKDKVEKENTPVVSCMRFRAITVK